MTSELRSTLKVTLKLKKNDFLKDQKDFCQTKNMTRLLKATSPCWLIYKEHTDRLKLKLGWSEGDMSDNCPEIVKICPTIFDDLCQNVFCQLSEQILAIV